MEKILLEYWILIVYIIGYILAYILLKRLRNIDNQNTWSDIFASIVLALFSYIMVVICMVVLDSRGISIIKCNIKIKPPKWL